MIRVRKQRLMTKRFRNDARISMNIFSGIIMRAISVSMLTIPNEFQNAV